MYKRQDQSKHPEGHARYDNSRAENAEGDCGKCLFQRHIKHCGDQCACPCAGSGKRYGNKDKQAPECAFFDRVRFSFGTFFKARDKIIQPLAFRSQKSKYFLYKYYYKRNRNKVCLLYTSSRHGKIKKRHQAKEKAKEKTLSGFSCNKNNLQ